MESLTSNVIEEDIHKLFPDKSQSYQKIMLEIAPYLSGSDTTLNPIASRWEVLNSQPIKINQNKITI